MIDRPPEILQSGDAVQLVAATPSSTETEACCAGPTGQRELTDVRSCRKRAGSELRRDDNPAKRGFDVGNNGPRGWRLDHRGDCLKPYGPSPERSRWSVLVSCLGPTPTRARQGARSLFLYNWHDGDGRACPPGSASRASRDDRIAPPGRPGRALAAPSSLRGDFHRVRRQRWPSLSEQEFAGHSNPHQVPGGDTAISTALI